MKVLCSDAPRHYVAKSIAKTKPWYLQPNYDQSEILIDPDGSVRAGTTTALVERLTAHEYGCKADFFSGYVPFRILVPHSSLSLFGGNIIGVY